MLPVEAFATRSRNNVLFRADQGIKVTSTSKIRGSTTLRGACLFTIKQACTQVVCRKNFFIVIFYIYKTAWVQGYQSKALYDNCVTICLPVPSYDLGVTLYTSSLVFLAERSLYWPIRISLLFGDKSKMSSTTRYIVCWYVHLCASWNTMRDQLHASQAVKLYWKKSRCSHRQKGGCCISVNLYRETDLGTILS